MTKFAGDVVIARPVDEVFDLYTNARLTAERADTRTLVEFTHIGEDGPGTQAVWTFIHPEMKTEMIETVIEMDRPHHIASHLQITRVLPLAPHEVTPGVKPMLAYDMKDNYSPLYGRLPVEGVMRCGFTPADGGTRLELFTEMKLGGLSRLFGWTSKLAKRHPMQAELDAFRDWIEAR
ncbi:hypothetical protein C8N43_3125 [Litoreibacter ponti]|uniref:Polyketide cyclase/dehydrase/lipid transport protein n=1 Tax=Litoreibacter ponti TaxID=1510457 RepID=A0A2T6BE37_9RHOB|nr:hypothetical protein [Litoreibacter ponti]PTX54311.1 hypothetical protein C8N43_3125 [Litoreibacter ponti]